MNRRNFLASAIVAAVAPTAFSKQNIPYLDGGSIPIPAPEKFFAGTNEVWATFAAAVVWSEVQNAEYWGASQYARIYKDSQRQASATFRAMMDAAAIGIWPAKDSIKMKRIDPPLDSSVLLHSNRPDGRCPPDNMCPVCYMNRGKSDENSQ